MKKINYILASLILSAVLPVSGAFAAGGTIGSISGTVSSETVLHVEGEASSGTNVVAVSVYDEAGTTLIVGPETTETDTSYNFSYDFTGEFDASVVYTVCAADYDGGAQTCEQTTATTPDDPSGDSSDSGTTPGSGDAGTAPKGSETTDKAVSNMSLGVSIVVASAIVYGVHLVVKHKKETN